ncbi:MAG: hypothetical protein FJW88_14680 [Actinobacteria bacterium]|nr:hypothetical protein [Actinomycetota bacterium]
MRKLLGGLVAAVVAVAGSLAGAGAAHAVQPVPGHVGLVPEAPRVDTPYVDTGAVGDIEVIGSRVYLAGTFTSIRDAGGAPVAQGYLAAYDIDSGRLDLGFRPAFDGEVTAIEASPDGSALYAAGRFNSVSGMARRKVAKLDPVSGAVVTAFRADADARATALAVSTSKVYVGGFFSTVKGATAGRLAALDPVTGAVDAGFALPVTGGIGAAGALKVVELALTTDEATLLVVHTGRQVGGLDRVGVALVDTAAKAVRPWQTSLFADNLSRVGGVVRLADGDIAPDDSYFVVVSGSGGDRPPSNDTAMAFPTTGGAGVEPLWVSRHFDSVFAVAISETAVYVGGHFRWQEAPGSTQPWPGDANLNYGWGSAVDATVLGDEVLRRDMVGALDPATGTTLDWNPGCEAFEGVRTLELIPRGLLLGHDGMSCGQRVLGRHAFWDFTRVPAPSPAETWLDTPFEGQSLAANGPVPFGGRAAAPSGVSRVQVELRDRGSGRYLQDDAVTFGAAWNAIEAALDTPGGPESAWTLDVTLPAGEYQVWARAFALDGSRDTTKATAKFYTALRDDALPVTTILLPAQGLLSALTFDLSGTATDDHGVSRLSFVAKHVDTGYYLQDDGTVAPAWSSFGGEPDAPGDANVTWSREITLPVEGTWDIWATAIDSAGQSDNRGARARYAVSATNVAPATTIAAPTSNQVVVPGSAVTISGVATDDRAVVRVEVRVRNLQTREGMAADLAWGVPAFARVTPLNTSAPIVAWTVTTPPLPPGRYEIIARAVDDLKVTTPEASRPNIKILSQYASPLPPETALDFAATTQDVDTLDLPITGTATGGGGIAAVKLVVFENLSRRYLTSTTGSMSSAYTLVDVAVASPGATATGFSTLLHLPGSGDYTVTAIALDVLGQLDTSTAGAEARYKIFPGDADPTSLLYSPADGSTLTNAVSISGRAFDDVAIMSVQVKVTNVATGKGLRPDGTFGTGEWLQAFVTNPGGPASNFVYTSPTLPPGTYRVDVQPVDSVTNVQWVPLTITVTVVTG